MSFDEINLQLLVFRRLPSFLSDIFAGLSPPVNTEHGAVFHSLKEEVACIFAAG